MLQVALYITIRMVGGTVLGMTSRYPSMTSIPVTGEYRTGLQGSGEAKQVGRGGPPASLVRRSARRAVALRRCRRGQLLPLLRARLAIHASLGCSLLNATACAVPLGTTGLCMRRRMHARKGQRCRCLVDM